MKTPHVVQVSITFQHPVKLVWAALTQPEWVKKYFFGSIMKTTWTPGTPILFEGVWEGTPYQDKGTVLAFEPEKTLSYNYFSSWSTLPDTPENYQTITYTLAPDGAGCVLHISQDNVPGPEQVEHSTQNWNSIMETLNQLLQQNQE